MWSSSKFPRIVDDTFRCIERFMLVYKDAEGVISYNKYTEDEEMLAKMKEVISEGYEIIDAVEIWRATPVELPTDTLL